MIVVTSTFTADVMHTQLTSLLPKICPQKINFVYQKIFSQLLLVNSESQQNQTGLNVFLIRLSDLFPYSSSTKPPVVEQFVTDFAYTLSTARAAMQAPLLLFFTPTPAHLKAEVAYYANIAQQIEEKIDPKRIKVLQTTELLSLYPQQYCAPFTDKYGHMPYALEFYNLLSTLIAEKYTELGQNTEPSLASLPPAALPPQFAAIPATRLLPHTEQMIRLHIWGLCKRHGLLIDHPDHSLVALGLDSLRATHLASDILQTYHFSINPWELLAETMTLQGLYHLILNKLSADTLPKAKQNSDSFAHITCSLSNAQKRLWYDEKISEGTNRNNLSVAFTIPKNCDRTILERAFNTLLARHDALRFSFHAEGEEPVLTCHPQTLLSIKLLQEQVEDELALRHFLEQFQQKPFDLSQAPLLRVAVVESPKSTVLLLCIHHLIHDGWSLHILCQELSLLYQAYSHHLDPRLPRVAKSYKDFICWQQQAISADVLAIQKGYWQRLLDKLPMMTLHYDQPLQKWHEPTPLQRIEFQLNSEISLQLKRAAAKHTLTLYDLLASAFGLLLSHYTQQEDISFLTAVSGRHHPQFNHVIGFFVNLLLVRFHIPEHISWNQWLKNNKKVLQEIFAHQELPLHDILQVTGEMVNAKIHSFIQAGFIFQNYPLAQLSLENSPCPRVLTEHGSSLLYNASREYRFGNLVCFMQETPTQLSGMFEYNPALFQAQTIRDMLDAFTTLLTHIADNPSGSARAIPAFVKPHFKNLPPQTEMITFNGYAIDLSLIEAQLQTHPFVKQAAVVYHGSHPEHLAAYIVLHDSYELSDINLYHHLQTHLPKYMLPKVYSQMDCLPLTTHGKVDKTWLASASLPVVTYREYESSQSLLQDKIIAIFAKVLQIDASLIGINASFFDLGGSSISALRLIYMLNDQFHITINFSLLYDHATVKLLSQRIADLLSKNQFVSLFTHSNMSHHTLKQIKVGAEHSLPIIFIHPMGGTGCCYLDLIKVLPDDQPCYVLHDPSIDAQQMLFDDMVSMAGYYNHMLLKHFPSSCFVLAGYAFGGLIALEMIGQLEQKKLADRVHSMVAFDTWISSNFQPQIRATLICDATVEASSYYNQLQTLTATYVPPKITKKIVLFKASQPQTDYDPSQSATNFLQEITTKPVETHIVACNHDTILHWPHVRSIGNLITQYIWDSTHEYEIS